MALGERSIDHAAPAEVFDSRRRLRDTGRETALNVLDAENAEAYWERDERHDFSVSLNRGRPALEQAAAELRAAGAADVVVCPADVTDEAGVRAVVEGAVARFGRLDVVVHCAQVMAYGRIEDVPADVLARSTWQPGCPVAADDLAYVRLTFWGFDDQRHTGELLLARHAAPDLVRVFRALYRAVYRAVAAGEPGDDYPTFRAGHVENILGEAAAQSNRDQQWVEVVP